MEASSWFFITADYAFGKQLEATASELVKAGGGTVVGDVRVPLGTSDFSSYLLQAQSSGAQVLALANAGTDTSNSLKAAAEFGLTKTMRPAALLVFLSDVHALGLDTAQGLVLTTSWYWNTNDDACEGEAWAAGAAARERTKAEQEALRLAPCKPNHGARCLNAGASRGETDDV